MGGRHLVRAIGACVVGLMFAAVVEAQTADPAGKWSEQLGSLEQEVRTLPADDQAARTRVSTALRSLDAEISAWLSERGLTVEQPAPEGTQLADVTAELSRVRALVEQARAGLSSDGDTASGVFYLGRVDVAVTGQAPSASGVTVIDDALIRTLDAKTVSDAAAMATGVNSYRVGARNEGMIFIRGFDLRQVPLFVDGVPIYVPYDGYVDLDRFITPDLAEVRVTKGMTSVLIGPNALGGAINLVSKRPTRPIEGLANVTYGSGSERMFDASVGRAATGWYFYGAGAWLQSDDFPLSDDFTPVALEDGGGRNNSARKDGKANLKFALTPSGKGEYVISYVMQRGDKGVPPYAGTNAAVRPRFWQWPDWDKDSVYFASNTPIGQQQYVRGRVYYDRFYNELDAYDDATYSTMTRPSSFRSIYDDYSDGASVEWGASLANKHTLRASGSWKSDIHREHNVGEPIRKFHNRTLSTGIEDTFTLSNLVTIVGGISYDHQQTLQAENLVSGAVADFPPGSTGGVNPQVALYVATPHGGRARVAAYHKTRLPAIKERYSYRMGTAIPNPDLKAERATTFEVGYDTPVGHAGTVALTGFYTGITDLVQAVVIAPNLSQNQNVGDVRHSGFEVEWRLSAVHDLQGSIGYSYLKRTNVDGSTAPPLPVPHNKLFGYAVYSGVPRLRLIGGVNYESDRLVQDDAGVFLELDGYSTVTAKASFALLRSLDIDFGMTNAFDTNYQVSSGFPEAGRIVYGGLHYRF